MPGGGSVLELVSRLRGEDGELQPLLSTIDELAQRVQYCSFYNGPVEVGPPRRRGNAATDNTATGMGSMYSSKGPSQLQHGSGPEEAAGGEAGEGGSGEPSTSSPTGGGTGGGGVGGGGGRLGPGRSRTQRVEDAELPDVPDDRGLHDKDEPSALPGPQLCSEWDALTGAVAVACASFSSTNAKVTFKKWALTPANASLLVSLFWWLVADVFVSEAPMAGPLKDYVFHVFARHYTGVVLPYRSINKDAYVELWARSMATAVVTLLREAFPRSSHRFDESIEAYVHAQLVRWTAGALPADMHPSMYSAPGDRAPAASRLAGKPATTTGTTTATPASARRAATNTAAATATSARRAPPPAADLNTGIVIMPETSTDSW
ncbi:hypothetical protein FOA52_004714 [Chlamydomonas sp. UWO 241]|nr:hypothetical protein FOA52_004714 [Chlamydomonas sp. UWO 241]